MKTKHTKGDKVKITNNDKLCSFKNGEEVTIIIIDPLSDILKYYIEKSDGEGCWVNENEIEAIKKAIE
ncbi:hypothetical protein ES703_32260 [subsurface metagenome]